jgi:hypothetical protein
MRALATALVVLSALAAAPAAAGGAPGVADVRICTQLRATDGACPAAAAAQIGPSPALWCSFRVAADTAGSVVAVWTYNGATTLSERIPYVAGPARPGHTSIATSTKQPLPGGTYSCSIAAGPSAAETTSEVDGPTDTIVDVAVCTGTQARELSANANFPMCPTDTGKRPVAGAGGGSLVCDATFANAAGEEASLALYRAGVLVGSETIAIDGPIVQTYLERPNKSKPTPLFPGSYTCEISIAGGDTVTKEFTVVQGRPSPTDAAVHVLRELSELHVRDFDVRCGPLALLSQILNRDPGMVVLGAARIKGKSMLLDESLICRPLAGFEAARPRHAPSKQVLLALSVVAHEYGHVLGIRRENEAECFAVRTTWKWVRRSNLGATASAAARAFLLDNRRRPPEYKLLPSCALPG